MPAYYSPVQNVRPATERFKRCSVCGSRLAKAATGTAHPKCLRPRVPGYQPDHEMRHAAEFSSLIHAAASGLGTIRAKTEPSDDRNTL